MKIKALIVLVFWLSNGNLFCQQRRLAEEPLETFIERIKPEGSEVAHKVLSIKSWHHTPNVIIALYAKTVTEQLSKDIFTEDIILAKIFIPVKDNYYQEVLIDTLYGEAGTPSVASVFFAEVHPDFPGKELLVMISSSYRHMEAWGTYYTVYAYNTKSLAKAARLDMVYDFSPTGDLEYSSGEKSKANYRTAAEFLAHWKKERKE